MQMANTEPQNCWEFWNCRKEILEKCTTSTMNSGKRCWMIAESITINTEKCPKLQNKFKDCWECPWFIKLNPNFLTEGKYGF